MGTILNKLWSSKGTIIILVWIAVFAYAYNLDYIKKPVINHIPKGRTVEEIIATSIDNTAPPAWDTEFKSSIIPEDK
jgi:hypothetical protein